MCLVLTLDTRSYSENRCYVDLMIILVGTDETVDDEDFQLTMMRRLRQVNVDHQHVGWYQSSQFGNFLSPQLLESQFSYQTSIDESICLIFGETL